MHMRNFCLYGDIFMARLPEGTEGSIQNGIRPVLIVSNDLANKHSSVITILPITSSQSKSKLPTHVEIQDCGLTKRSLILAEQITSLNRKNLQRKMGTIRLTVYEERVKKAMAVQLNL